MLVQRQEGGGVVVLSGGPGLSVTARNSGIIHVYGMVSVVIELVVVLRGRCYRGVLHLGCALKTRGLLAVLLVGG